MLEVISQDYIRTARSKGLAERLVIYKHALRNMMIPLLTIIGLFVAIALTGTVLTETVFTRPGLGKMLVDGASSSATSRRRTGRGTTSPAPTTGTASTPTSPTSTSTTPRSRKR
jgi:hypothetical protein